MAQPGHKLGHLPLTQTGSQEYNYYTLDQGANELARPSPLRIISILRGTCVCRSRDFHIAPALRGMETSATLPHFIEKGTPLPTYYPNMEIAANGRENGDNK
jgi:hypothetical protein